MIRSLIVLLPTIALTGCARRYTTHWEDVCPPARAQSSFAEDRSSNGALHGIVLDRDTGKPLQETLVRVVGLNKATRSDSTGAFSIGGLTSGPQVVTLLRVGYARRVDTITVRAGRAVRAQITLTPLYFDRCPEVVEVRTPLPWWHFW